ncbi:hypothetical protein KUCAC02_015039 [Chaenocephalus aceratus]|uniref:Uncharacterized protein n=1 Tax=Chaenocephalus aceratus TaxID=36190 RepID=A0ACB9XW38_CHAAC|nr:hypothetical protein KUCAC02_015039 [Chaenocephalus aceratus]
MEDKLWRRQARRRVASDGRECLECNPRSPRLTRAAPTALPRSSRSQPCCFVTHRRRAKDTSKGDAALRQAKRVLQISRRRRTVTVKVEESLRSQAFLKKLGSPSCPRF